VYYSRELEAGWFAQSRHQRPTVEGFRSGCSGLTEFEQAPTVRGVVVDGPSSTW